jgi:hypothetical protein
MIAAAAPARSRSRRSLTSRIPPDAVIFIRVANASSLTVATSGPVFIPSLPTAVVSRFLKPCASSPLAAATMGIPWLSFHPLVTIIPSL